jgi:hypothetical protein
MKFVVPKFFILNGVKFQNGSADKPLCVEEFNLCPEK